MEQKATARVANGSTGGGKGRFIESKVALPEEINSILQFKALSDGTLEVVGQDADYSIYVAKSSDGGGSWETTPLERYLLWRCRSRRGWNSCVS